MSDSIIYISHDTPVYMRYMKPEDIGLKKWEQLETSGLVLGSQPIGKGVPFEQHERFRVLHEGFVEKKPWNETKYYQKTVDYVNAGNSRWGCKTEAQVRNRFYNELPKLFESIERRGLLTQAELAASDARRTAPRGRDQDIKVALNENGDLLFLDGAHRLGIAKILKLQRIPVRVMFVHQSLGRDALRRVLGDVAEAFPSASAQEEEGERLGGILINDHLLLSGFRPKRTLRRRNLIVSSALNVEGKSVLDVGCAEGLTSLYLSERAKKVVGVDHRSSVINIAKNTARMLGKTNVEFYANDVRNEELFGRLGRFDLIVAWGLIHRITDPFELLYRLADLTDTLSLEWPTPVLPRMETLSFAVHPPHGDSLDPMNTAPAGAHAGKDDAIKVEGNTAFWEMTPGAVKTILGRLGFRYFKILGYGERFLSEKQILKKKNTRDIFHAEDSDRIFSNERLHMIASRNPVDTWIDPDFNSRELIPSWDFAANEGVFKQKS